MSTAKERNMQQLSDLPEVVAEGIISDYLRARERMEEWQIKAEDARRRLSDLIEQTGRTTWETAAGKASVTAPSTTVSYDARALDALAASSPEIAAILAPHRKVTERAGTLRITNVVTSRGRLSGADLLGGLL
jgi:hypothetical protein